MRFTLLLVTALFAPAQDFGARVYPVLEKAGCRACHTEEGVASATRLHFPPAAASARQIEAFGRSLVEFIEPAEPSRSPLWRKPTGRSPHAGGLRIAVDSPGDHALHGWVLALSRLSGAERVEALGYRAREASGAGYAVAPIYLRRLSHAEYNNIVRDLLGDTSQPASGFPPEDFVNGFKTQYQAQSISPLLMEAYSAAAEKVARNALRRGIVPAKPSARFVADFGLRLFRRPLTATELKRYQALLASGGSALVIEAMLQSSAFLFRLEAANEPALEPYVIASRLSFTLWASAPDDALLAAAGRGELQDPVARLRHAQRLLADDRARGNIDEFTAQWLRFDRILGAVKERRRFPLFSREAAVAMTEEARRFVGDLAWSDRSFMELFTDPHGYMTSDLAAIYGAPAPELEYSRVAFPLQSGRAGILGQALFLASTAKPDDTSPTARGLFVREQLLCQHVPPPPPGVDTNLPVLSEAKPLTNKQRLAVHLSNSSCAGCHTLIDPIGFGFEKFDAIGSRRETARLVFAARKGNSAPSTVELPLETQGYVAGLADSAFDTPAQLGAILARSPVCQDCIVRQIFRYTLGRMETPADRRLLRHLFSRFRDSQFRFKELMLALAVEERN
ncbi:MAG: DUF1592 domain-containing protein [Bryobacter sp.]|jgi:hypothetical protein|nr:DUF1592 domain-containing protein [Bryobacter sp. CoA8 C33]